MTKRRSRYEVWGASTRSKYFRKLPNARKFAEKLKDRTTGVQIYDLKNDTTVKG